MSPEELKTRYGASDFGNFAIIDQIGVPHPYCIGPKHVEVAADQFGGMLGEAAIEAAERQGAKCCICKGKLKYAEHKRALLIDCKVDPDSRDEFKEELSDYLLKSKPLAEADSFAGFAFKDSFSPRAKAVGE